eukprot:6278157-Amphidinium_carterae.1
MRHFGERTGLGCEAFVPDNIVVCSLQGGAIDLEDGDYDGVVPNSSTLKNLVAMTYDSWQTAWRKNVVYSNHNWTSRTTTRF